MTSPTISVERIINAPASRIFALLADAGRHSSFDGSDTVRGIHGENQPLCLGTKFGMSMKARAASLFVPYRTTNEIVEFEQDRLIAWQTTAQMGIIGGRIWRYELIPSGAGTLVRETWDVSKDKQRFFLLGSSLPSQTREGMRETLDRLARAVES